MERDYVLAQFFWMDIPSLTASYIVNSASSVLQKNTKLYGPMNCLDVRNESSSWNSEGNSETDTTLVLHFGRSVIPTTMKLQFQAGFSAELVQVYDSNMTKLSDVELDDIHEIQTFHLQDNQHSFRSLKFILDNFADFYGRIILYRLEVWGYEVPE
jgi:hypothetical protein